MNFKKAEKKASELVSQMTLEEKLSQLLYTSKAIERLSVHEYNWWNEAAHGVARAGVATVFPQAIGMAATFNTELINSVASAVSEEARAKYNKSAEYNDYDIYKGLTFWTPNINIFRDPRWGRGQETFGECPYLTAKMGVSYIKGLQGDGEFLKSAACAKHFAVHSGPEVLRHSFDAKVSKKDLFETYLPAFEYAVKAGVIGVMGAYNRTNGEPCCAHSYLLGDVLKKKWGFKGYVVSDCGAIADINKHHKFTDTMSEAAAVSLKNGCDLNCGEAYLSLIDAYEEDLITEEDIDRAVTKLYTVRALLGEFEDKRPFTDIPYAKLDCKEHKALNLETAKQSLVLLKNEQNFLPITKENTKIAVIGPNANSILALEGNYNGHASKYITVASGIGEVFGEENVTVAEGSSLWQKETDGWDGITNIVSEAKAAASESDITVLVLGLDRHIEGEELNIDDEFAAHGDRKHVSLPQPQIRLAEALCDVAENLVVVVLSGSSTDLGERVNTHAKAIIHAWYPGALGGLAIAKLLKGEFSPSGKLPLTFYKKENSLPDFADYSMSNRTYRYFSQEPLYPFGFGLSFANANYDSAQIKAQDENTLTLSISLANNSDVDITEKVQIYAKINDSKIKTPNYQLCGIKPVFLASGESKTEEITVEKYWLKAVNDEGERVDADGKIILYVGSHQPDDLSTKLSGTACAEIQLNNK